VSGLVKTFGPTHALDGLDLTVTAGEVHGFVGPHGAGKTTTIRVLLGLLRPDAGEARLLGGDPWRDAVALHRRLAYVPGDVSLWPKLTGGEIIDVFGRLRGSGSPSACSAAASSAGAAPFPSPGSPAAGSPTTSRTSSATTTPCAR